MPAGLILAQSLISALAAGTVQQGKLLILVISQTVSFFHY